MELGTRRAYRRIQLILLILLAIAALTYSADKASAMLGWNPPPRAHWMRTPCAQEDSTNCAWNANLNGLGNGGHSFYVVRRPLEGPHGRVIGRVDCVYYVKTADHHWDACHVLLP